MSYTRKVWSQTSGKHIEPSLKREKVPLRLEKQFRGDVTKRVAVLYDVTLAKLIIHYVERLNKNSPSALIWLILGTALQYIPFHFIS